MKKIFNMLLFLVMIFSICSCSGTSKKSKEEMIETAQTIEISEIIKAADENLVTAQDTHIGKIYKLSGFVKSIEKDYITIGSLNNEKNVTVHIPKEEIKQIIKNQQVDVVGEITKIELKEVADIEMASAYIINDIYEITGTVNCTQLYKSLNLGAFTSLDWNFIVSTDDNKKYYLEDYIPEEDRVIPDPIFISFDLPAGRLQEVQASATINEQEFKTDDIVTVLGKVYREYVEGGVHRLNMEPISIIKN